MTQDSPASADLTFWMRANRMKAAARIRDLELDLAEARAQIAAKDAYITELNRDLAEALDERNRARVWIVETRAQIAAKDAALTRIVNECSRFPIKDGLAFRVESIALNALAAPARETE